MRDVRRSRLQGRFPPNITAFFLFKNVMTFLSSRNEQKVSDVLQTELLAARGLRIGLTCITVSEVNW